MRILIITHSYTPELTPRAFRWAVIARSLVTMGHAVDVVCARSAQSPAHELLSGVEVHRARDFLIRRPASVTAGQSARVSQLYRLARWVYGYTWRKLYWPDSACGWFFPSLRLTSRLIKNKKYDWLISVSHPFTGHLIGLVLKRRYPKLSWLVDMGDPFCIMEDPSPNNAALYRRLNRRIDLAVLRKANVVSVTTSGTRDAYIGFFPDVAKKMWVIPPMLSLPVHTGSVLSVHKSTPLRLVYVGTLYSTLRSPLPLLELFERLVSLTPGVALELHFLGHINDCADLFNHYQHWLGSRIFVHGVVSRARAQEYMEGAHILINLGNRSTTQLPSKVIEYVAMGKPILNLATIRNDSSTEILATYPAALTLYMDSSTMLASEAQKIAEFVAKPPVVEASRVREWLAPYTEQSVCQEYTRLLNLGATATHTAPGKSGAELS